MAFRKRLGDLQYDIGEYVRKLLREGTSHALTDYEIEKEIFGDFCSAYEGLIKGILGVTPEIKSMYVSYNQAGTWIYYLNGHEDEAKEKEERLKEEWRSRKNVHFIKVKEQK